MLGRRISDLETRLSDAGDYDRMAEVVWANRNAPRGDVAARLLLRRLWLDALHDKLVPGLESVYLADDDCRSLAQSWSGSWGWDCPDGLAWPVVAPPAELLARRMAEQGIDADDARGRIERAGAMTYPPRCPEKLTWLGPTVSIPDHADPADPA